MKFTAEEMIYFHSVTREAGELNIDLPEISFLEKEKYIIKTIENLKKKGILEDDNSVTELGKLMLKVVESYKKSKQKCILNGLRIGVGYDDIVPVIADSEEGYEILFHAKHAILEGLISAYPFLKEGQAGRQKREAVYVSYEEWLKEFEKIPHANILSVIVLKQEEGVEESHCYYFDGEQIYSYFPYRKTKYKKGPRDVRVELMNLLYVKEDEPSGGDADSKYYRTH